ncbi:MAG: acetolactate synthase large subunit [Micromonosporaceae bacterium]|nr:acetolactate synthase large subunit [Micromonosporaceae bacterium]
MHSGDAIARLLAAGGVRRFYTVPGESFLEIIDGVDRHANLDLISARHEGGAVFMALADATVTGQPAVVAATRGVGGANLAIGVHTAYQESLPLIVMLGQVETPYLGREGFQEVDLPAFFGPISKLALTVQRTDRIPELVSEAIRVATIGRPGPVVLAFPADVLAEDVDPEAVERWLRRVGADVAPAAPDPGGIDRIAAALAGARRPVVIAGGGARGAREELREVAERYGTGVYTAFRRQDVFDNSHPLFLGHLGLGTASNCLDALREADLVLVVGCRLGEITTSHYVLPNPASVLAQVDIDSRAIGAVTPADIGVVSQARPALRALLDRPEAGSGGSRDWSAARERLETAAVVGPSRASLHCDPALVIAALAAAAPPDAVLTNDAGNFSAFMHRHWCFRTPGSQVGVANGAMGYGVPAAIGVKLAAPDRTVIGLVGDGGFLMTGLDLETAVRYDLDLTIVVFRNGLHGTIAMHQAREVGRLAGTDIGPVDFAGLARSLGAFAVTVKSESELKKAFEQALAHPGPAVVEVMTDPDLITPEARLSDLLASAAGSPQ